MKSFALCESDTGYIWNCFLYTGKETTDGFATELASYNYQATKIVLTLMDNLLEDGYHLYVDNWYTSYELCKVLLDYNTDCIGTLQINRKKLPPDIKNAKRVKSQSCITISLTTKERHFIVYNCSSNRKRTNPTDVLYVLITKLDLKSDIYMCVVILMLVYVFPLVLCIIILKTSLITLLSNIIVIIP